MLSRLAARGRDERGFSLPELLVAIGLLGVVGAILASGLIGGFRTSGLVQHRTTAMSELQVTAERMARELRAAAPIQRVTAGTTPSVSARVYKSGTCARVTYRIEGSELAQYTQALTPLPAADGVLPNTLACTTPAVADPPPATAVRRVLVRDLDPGRTSFVYRRGDGQILHLAGADVGRESSIRTVELVLARRVPRGGTVQVETTVLLRNQETNR